MPVLFIISIRRFSIWLHMNSKIRSHTYKSYVDILLFGGPRTCIVNIAWHHFLGCLSRTNFLGFILAQSHYLSILTLDYFVYILHKSFHRAWDFCTQDRKIEGINHMYMFSDLLVRKSNYSPG